VKSAISRYSTVEGSDRRNGREQADQNGQCQKSTQKKRHFVHVALLNAELAVHRTLRDEGLPRVTGLRGYFEPMTAPVTEADCTEKCISDAHLILSQLTSETRLRSFDLEKQNSKIAASFHSTAPT
jgi:hypothetical protein